MPTRSRREAMAIELRLRRNGDEQPQPKIRDTFRDEVASSL
jgi:hypothetical protein